ncbi:MAG: hypothetical protein E4G95_04225 [Bacteroidia bacterium]|nr:MAG: hypothetical protein E4G95_04225 [Bacteroidia bacterium]
MFSISCNALLISQSFGTDPEISANGESGGDQRQRGVWWRSAPTGSLVEISANGESGGDQCQPPIISLREVKL